MEGSSSTSHIRSISLPSRFTHQSCTEIETRINELKALGNLVGSCSSQTIQSGLVGLAELYVCVDKLVRSQRTQQVLTNHQSGPVPLVEDALEGSIGLLDSCSILKDLMMLMKENVQILQSALRRKAGDPTISSQIAAYQCFRKRFRKSVIKSLETLKRLEKKMGSFLLLDVDHHGLMVSKVLGEVNALTISIFKSLLVFMSLKSKPTNGVQLLSKLVSKSKSTHDIENETFVNEVESVDMATMFLHKSVHNNEMKNVDVQMILRKLEILDVTIDGFEAGLDCIFRKLIQSRASLLNIVVC